MTKKIAVIASSIHPIRQKHLLDWYEDLFDKDFDAQLFLGSKNKNIPYAINYKVNSRLEKFKYEVLNIFKHRLKLEGLKKIEPLVSYKPDVIHLLTSNTFPNIEPILKDKNIKLIVSFRGFDINVFPKQSEANKKLTRQIFERADILHFISYDLKKSAIKMNADEKKCMVLHRSIRTDEYDDFNLIRKKKPRSIILSVGRLVWEKGYLYALETISLLKKKGYNFEYQIAGKGIDYNMLIFHAERLNIKDRVLFLGELSPKDIKLKLLEADIYFQPSVSEALSLAILEASFHGLPIVSSDIGGIPEVVENQSSGFLSAVCDPEKYANSISKLLDDIELRIKMGEKARLRILKNFSRSKEIKKWRTIYSGL